MNQGLWQSRETYVVIWTEKRNWNYKHDCTDVNNRLGTHPWPIVPYGFWQSSEWQQLSVWWQHFPTSNRLYNSSCFPSVFWLATCHFSLSCAFKMTATIHSSLSSSSSLIAILFSNYSADRLPIMLNSTSSLSFWAFSLCFGCQLLCLGLVHYKNLVKLQHRSIAKFQIIINTCTSSNSFWAFFPRLSLCFPSMF